MAWTTRAKGYTARFGDKYCPQFSYDIEAQPADATTQTIKWKIWYVTHGYVWDTDSIPVSFSIGEKTLFNERVIVRDLPSFKVASGEYTVSRGESNEYVYPILSVYWSGTLATWNGTTKSDNEIIDSDYFVLFGKLGNVTNVSLSGNTISWTNPKNGQYVEIWGQGKKPPFHEITKISVDSGVTSYTVNTPTNDVDYQYKLRASDGVIATDFTDVIHIRTTPIAPTSLHPKKIEKPSILFAVENESKSANSIELQYSSDNKTWKGSIKSTNLNEIEFTQATTPYYYRVRNLADGKPSTWLTTALIAPDQTAPDKPTWVNIKDGDYFDPNRWVISDIEWTYSNADGSRCKGYKLEISVNNAEPQTMNVGFSTPVDSGETIKYKIRFADFGAKVGDTVKLRVANKGWSETTPYGEWSDYVTLNLKTAEIDEPVFTNPITELPWTLDWGNTTKFLNTWYIKDGDTIIAEGVGKKVFRTLQELPIEDNKQYSIRYITQERDTGLRTEKTVTVNTKFWKPAMLDVEIENDKKTGYTTIYTEEKSQANKARVVRFDVYLRDVDDNQILMVKDATPWDDVIDKYATCAPGSNYLFVLYAETGTTATMTAFPTRKPFHCSYFYWNNKVLQAALELDESISFDMPDLETVQYLGREFPVAYSSNSKNEDISLSFEITTSKEYYNLTRLWKNGGRCIYKNDYEAFRAVAVFSFTPYHNGNEGGKVKASIKRLDGDVYDELS